MKKILLLISLSVVLAACSDTETSNNPSGESAGTKQTTEESCVSSFIDKPCSLLTTDLLVKEFPDFPDNVKNEEAIQIQSCSYSWPSEGRTRVLDLAGRKMEIPVNNEIGIKWIRKKKLETALQSFKKSYRTLSEKEKIKASEAMDDALKRNSGDLNKNQKEVASGISKGFLKNIKYEPVSGLGTAATWGGVGPGDASLKVLDGDTEFEITVNISDIEADNRGLAVSVARSVMVSCQ